MKSPETNPAVSALQEPAEHEVDHGGRGQLPVAVSEGDFSTPTKRTRKITRPRGVKSLEQPLAIDVPAIDTPPPPATESRVPAVPVDLAGGGTEPAAVPSRQASVVEEFLAAPPTPPPEILETPAPDLISQYRLTDVFPDDQIGLIENVEVAADLRSSTFDDQPVEAESVGEQLDEAPVYVQLGEAQSVGGQPVEAQSVGGQPVEAQFVGEQPVEAQSVGEQLDEAPIYVQLGEAQSVGEQPVEAQFVGEQLDEAPVYVQLGEAQPVGGQPVGAQSVGGRSVEWQPPEAFSVEVEVEPVEGELVESESVAIEVEGIEIDSGATVAAADFPIEDVVGPTGQGAQEEIAPDANLIEELLDRATAAILASSPDEIAISDVSPESDQVARPDEPVLRDLSAAADEVALPERDRDFEVVVGLSERASQRDESDLSPLAQTLANMAEAMHGDLAMDPTVDLDIGDGPLVSVPSEGAGSGPPRTPPPRTVPPPPPLAGALASSASVVESRPPEAPLARLPEALAERPRRPKRSKPWFEEVFDESYLRTLPFMTAEQTLREVDFIESSLAVPRGSEVLDVACGYGRHAIELVQRGLSVTGVDLSLPLLIRAADESQRRAVSVNFVHTDMRELSFEHQFSGAYCMLTSFGYFDEESNLKVAQGIARALKPGGRLLIDVINRDYVVGDLPARIWWEGDGCVVLEEVDFNFNTNRILTHRSVVFEDGQQVEHEISIRVYSLHELGKLLRQAGFRVIEVSGGVSTRGTFFGANSRNLLILAERRSE